MMLLLFTPNKITFEFLLLLKSQEHSNRSVSQWLCSGILVVLGDHAWPKSDIMVGVESYGWWIQMHS